MGKANHADRKNTNSFYDMYQQNNASFIRNYDERMKRSKKKVPSPARAFTIRFFILLFVCSLGAALFGTVYFGSRTMKIDPLGFDIRGPSSPRSSEKVIYEIIVSNSGDVPFTHLSLNIEFPGGFHFEESNIESSNADHTYWKVPNIQKNRKETIIIKGMITGRPLEEKKLRAQLHYRIGEAGTEFIAKKEHSSRINEQVFPLTLLGPTIVEPGKEVSYTLRYGDILQSILGKDSIIRIVPPKQFTYTSMPAEQNNQWTASILEQNATKQGRSGEIVLKGTFDAALPGDYELIAQYGSIRNKEFIIAQEQNLRMYSIENPLLISFHIGNATEPQPVSFGSDVPVRIHYENKTNFELNDVILSLSSDSVAIDWADVKNASLGTLRDTAINWSSKERPEFERIAPSQQGDVNVILRIKDSSLIDDSIPASVQLTANASESIRINGEMHTVSNKPLIAAIPLNSDVRMYVSVSKTDISSQYAISCDIENSLHELRDIAVTLPLGASTDLKGSLTRSAGTISYNKESRSIIWTLNRFPLSVHSIHASFIISGQEMQADNQAYALIEQSTLTATDAVTQKSITLSTPAQSAESAAGQH